MSNQGQNPQADGMLNAVIEFAGITIKAIILTNGAAAISGLAFLGHVIAAATSSALPPDQITQKISIAILLAPAMKAYIIGVLFGLATAATAYLSQVLFSEGRSPRKIKIGEILRYIGVIMAIIGIVSFACGGFLAMGAFDSYSEVLRTPVAD